MDAFTGNDVWQNGAVSTTRDGIEIASGSELDMDSYAMNSVQGNGEHEISIAGSGRLNAYSGANTICDVGDPGVTGNYVHNTGSYTADAVWNWWGTPSPSAGLFHGPVYYYSPMQYPYAGSCTVSSARQGEVRPSASLSASSGAFTAEDARSQSSDPQAQEPDLDALRQAILDARVALTAGAATAEGAALAAELYRLQRRDRADALGEAAATYALLATYGALLDEAGLAAPLRAVAERAALIALDEALIERRYDEAAALADEVDPYVESEAGQAELAHAQVTVLAVAGRTEEALAELEASRAVLGEAYAAFVEAELADRSAAGSSAAAPQSAVRGAAAQAEAAWPAAYALLPARPNPFTGQTRVAFTLPEASHVVVEVYDLLGRRVAVLAEGFHEASEHEVALDGSQLASGVYLVRAVMEPEAGDAAKVFTQRIALLK